MKKIFRIQLPLVLVIAAWFLGACQPAAPASPNTAAPDAGQAAAPTTVPAAVSTGVSTAPAAQPTTAPTLASVLDLPASGTMPGCTVTSMREETDTQIISILGDITDQDRVWGSADAPVTIIEYADFQCPFCAQFSIVLSQLKADYPDTLRVVYRHFPLMSIHDKAALSAQAADAAGLQGKFWEMHDLLYKTQSTWANLSVSDFQTWVIEQAGGLGLDVDAFTQDMLDEANATAVENAYNSLAAIGMPGTPFVLINWIPQQDLNYSSMVTIINLLALEQRQYQECPPVVIDPARDYFATLQTERGEIVIELLPEKAPLAVNNFVFLAQSGWYDGVTFHRVLDSLPIAQAGDPSGTGFGTPGYAFKNENSDLKFDGPGWLAMANAGADSNGSQFFITKGPTPHLDGGYTIFGRVIAGQDVVDSLTIRDPASSSTLPPGDRILSVSIEEK